MPICSILRYPPYLEWCLASSGCSENICGINTYRSSHMRFQPPPHCVIPLRSLSGSTFGRLCSDGRGPSLTALSTLPGCPRKVLTEIPTAPLCLGTGAGDTRPEEPPSSASESCWPVFFAHGLSKAMDLSTGFSKQGLTLPRGHLRAACQGCVFSSWVATHAAQHWVEGGEGP